jgi:SEC-C motif-containing protein
MRARYSAHVLKLPDFVVATYHPSCAAEAEREGITESVNLNWVKLEVLDAPMPEETEGFVEFKASLQDEDGIQCMHERSRFIKENGLWYYIDGVFPGDAVNTRPQQPQAAAPKVGRNDPCPCGSGKKYKKCCG